MERLLQAVMMVAGIGSIWYLFQSKKIEHWLRKFKKPTQADRKRTFETNVLFKQAKQKVTLDPHSLSIQADPLTSTVSPEVVTFYLVAVPNAPYWGSDLQVAFKAAGLHYGDMKLYHYHKDNNPQTKPLFSVASHLEPGTFDIGDMPSFKTTGLSLFLVLKPSDEILTGFEKMVNTAKQLADRLGGTLEDLQKMPLTEHNIALHRQQVKTYLNKAHVGEVEY